MKRCGQRVYHLAIGVALLCLLGLSFIDAEESTLDLRDEQLLVRWSFWVPAERIEEMVPVFSAEIAPMLARHGFVDPRPDTRVIPDSLFNRVYAVPSRQSFEVMLNAVESDPRWLELMEELGGRFERMDGDGRLIRLAAPYSDPAGPGTRRYSPPGKVIPVGPGRGHWTTYGVPEGLPSLDLSCLYEDRSGNIWICSFGSGLSRWDGEGFTTFTPEDGLAGLQPRTVMQDRAGHVWITFQDGGVTRYDGTQFESFDIQAEADLALPWVYLVYEDRRGQLWFPAASGLVRYDGQTFRKYTTDDGLAGAPLGWASVLEDRRGRLWVGTDAGVSRWNGEEPVHFESIGPAVSVWQFLEDRSGTIWAGGGWSREGKGIKGHAMRFDDDAWELLTREGGPITYNEHSLIQDMIEDRDGNIWILTESEGAFRWDGSGWTHLDDAALTGQSAYRMLQDQDGLFWFTTISGLRRWDGTEFTTYNVADGLDHGNIRTAIIDGGGDLWLGTIGNLSRYDPRRFTTFRSEHGISDNGGNSALRDRDGNLWLVSVSGVTRYDGQTFSTWTKEDGLDLHQGSGAFQDRDGAIWFGGYGAFHLQGDTLSSFSVADGLMPGWHGKFIQEPSGALWVGNGFGVTRYDGKTFEHFNRQDGLQPGSGIVRDYDRDGRLWINQGDQSMVFDGMRFTRSEVDDLLPPSRIRSQYHDRDGNIWFGSNSHGVSRWDGVHMTHYTMKDGLAHDAIRSIFQSADGHMWFGTDGGVVSRFDGRVFQTLSRKDGLNGQSVRDIDQDGAGDLWFTTYQGVIRYRQPEKSPPAVSIDAVVADRRYPAADEIVLETGPTLVSFEFHGRSFSTRPEAMVYRYRLQGHQDQWRNTRNTRIEYKALPVGEYTFEVIAVDLDLSYSEHPAQVQVKVRPQVFTSPLRLASVELEELFASFYGSYVQRSLGEVEIANDGSEPLEATLRFFIPELMRQPLEIPLNLAPQSTQQVVLQPRFDSHILDQQGPQVLAVELSLELPAFSIKANPVPQLTVYGPGALRWDTVARAAAFITPSDPQVQAFARPLLAAFEAQTQALGQPLQNLLQALVLFQALKQHGVRYLADAITPYAQVTTVQGAIDHIQYPAQTLQYKAGDCDDLTVLYASLLHSAGVPTALVDYPGHIFLLFDSGVDRDQAYRLPLPSRFYVVRGDRLWIPVEITQLHDSFLQAWQTGGEQLAKLAPVERIRRVVDTADAWKQYPATLPEFAGEMVPPERAAFEPVFEQQYAALREMIEAHIDATYLIPLKLSPDDDSLRTRLLKVYLGLHQFDTAISTALDYLVDKQGDKAGILNNLGIAYFLKGEIKQATFHFQQAAEIRPQDAGIQRNLTRALKALGRTVPGQQPIAEIAASGGSKAAVAANDGESFYWIE